MGRGTRCFVTAGSWSRQAAWLFPLPPPRERRESCPLSAIAPEKRRNVALIQLPLKEKRGRGGERDVDSEIPVAPRKGVVEKKRSGREPGNTEPELSPRKPAPSNGR